MNKADLKNLMCQIDPTLNDHEIDVIFRKFDADQSGEISKKEFLEVTIYILRLLKKETWDYMIVSKTQTLLETFIETLQLSKQFKI